MVCNFCADYQPPFFWLYVRLPLLECFFSFYYFLFLPILSTFKPLNAPYSKFERLKISGRTFVPLKSVAGIPLYWVVQNFELCTVTTRWIKFSKWVDLKNKLNQTKIWFATMEVSPKRALQNSNFLTF